MRTDFVQLGREVKFPDVVDALMEFGIGAECEDIGSFFFDSSVCNVVRIPEARR